MEPPWGNKPTLHYVSFTCLRYVSGERIQCCHLLTTLTEKQTLAKNAVSKYLHLMLYYMFDVIVVCL